MKSFNLVIPAYNEAKNLPLLLEKTLAAAREFGFTPSDFKLFLVNNGSSDNTQQVLNEWLQANSAQAWVEIVKVEQNQGYGHGIYSGLLRTSAEVLGFTHADLQCDPRNAFVAYKTLSNEHQIIKGVRHGRAPQERLVSSVFRVLAFLILGLKTNELNAQPKVFPKSLMAFLKNPPKTFAFDLYLLYCAQKQGYAVTEINVEFPPRIHGVSHWAAHFTGRYKTIWGMIVYMVNLFKTEGRV